MLSNFVLIDQTFFCGQPVAMRTSACAASTKPPFNPVQPKPVGQSGVPWQHCATPLSTQTGSEPRSCPKCREHQQHHTRCVSVFYINIPQRFCCSSQIQLSWSEQYIIRYFLPKVTFRIATIVLAVSLLSHAPFQVERSPLQTTHRLGRSPRWRRKPPRAVNTEEIYCKAVSYWPGLFQNEVS